VASVSVLYITDTVVGPHLELVRKVCEPGSGSKPHVTVRYFSKLSIPHEYLNTPVNHIDLIEPGSFLSDRNGRPHRTVYIRCRADDLVLLEHKPDYPASEFHITLYDGLSAEFSEQLLTRIQAFDWHFRVPLPDGTMLTHIPVKSARKKRPTRPREFSELLRQTFFQATNEKLDWNWLVELPKQRRLELCELLCAHLHESVRNYDRVGRSEVRVGPSGAGNAAGTLTEPEVHLTPPELAREIADTAVKLLDGHAKKIDFGDPAVGTGAFYGALLQLVPQDRLSSSIGIDISPRQVEAARWRWSHRGMDVMFGDYLHMERLPPRNLILANPPYLRHQAIEPKYKMELRERASVMMGTRIDARAGLYVYFMLLSHQWMADGAVAAWLIPSEFMQTTYGKAVRRYLTHRVRLVRVHRFDYAAQQFENARVLPAVVLFQNTSPTSGDMVTMTSGGTLSRPEFTQTVSVDELASDTRWTIPRVSDSEDSEVVRLGDLFFVSRGIATGANDFFILERSLASRLGIPKEALRPILPKVKTLRDDVIERQRDGYPRVCPQLCVIDCDLPEGEIKKRYPKLMEYLDAGKSKGVSHGTLARERNPWYRQDRRGIPLFVCTYMGRGHGDAPPLRFLWNRSDAIATNSYLLMYPRPALAKLLKTRPELVERLFVVLRRTAASSMAYGSRLHAEGLRKIEPGELLRIVLRNAPAWLRRVAEPQLPLEHGVQTNESLPHVSRGRKIS